MSKYRRMIFLVTLVVLSACVGIFLEHTEKQSYVLNIKTDASADKKQILYYEADDTLKTDLQNGKININTASKEELMTLEGIGEKRAEYIIEYRRTNGRFEVIEDIMKIGGIGREIFNGLKDYITVE